MKNGTRLAQKLADSLVRRERETLAREVADLLAEASKPDRSILEGLDFGNGRTPYGAAARLTPGAEREWQDNARLLPEEERKLRSYARDRQFTDWFKAITKGDHEAARRADPEWARTLTSAAGGDGLVAPDYFASLVFLKERDTGRLGPLMVQVNTTDTSVRVPWEKTVPTALKVDEGGDMTSGQTEPDVEAVSVTPVKIGQVFSLTRELVEDSPLAVVSVLAQRVAHAVGEAEDAAWLATTTGGTSFGAGNLWLGATASSDTWDDDAETLTTIISKMYEAPRDTMPRMRWCINTDAAKFLATQTSIGAAVASDRPILLPAGSAPQFVLDGLPGVGGANGWGQLAGLPVHVFSTTTLAANQAVLFDPSSVARVVRQMLYLDTDRGSGFLNDLVRVHVSRRVGGQVMQPTHVRRYPNA